MALTCTAGGLSELPEELDELTRVAHTLPQYMGLEGRVVLQFRNACTSTSTLMDRPVVGVPAYADALEVGEMVCIRPCSSSCGCRWPSYLDARRMLGPDSP